MEYLMTIYLAGPLFTHAERVWNAELARRLRDRGYRVILPQEADAEVAAGAGQSVGRALYQNSVTALEECDAVVAFLDGSDPDSGTAWECGYATKLGRPVIGVRTDLRNAGDEAQEPINLMLSQSCAELIVASALTADYAALVDQIDGALQRHGVRK
jgi:nucleoside 2-deoxyribosyltransferase